MSYTPEQLEALRAAVAKGVRVVSYDGNRVEYQSVDEMLRLIAVMERTMPGAAGGRRVYPVYTRGA